MVPGGDRASGDGGPRASDVIGFITFLPGHFLILYIHIFFFRKMIKRKLFKKFVFRGKKGKKDKLSSSPPPPQKALW